MKLPVNQEVYIRPFRKNDALSFVEAVHESVATVGAWTDWCRQGYSLQEAESWFKLCNQNLAAGLAYDYGLFSVSTDQVLGGIAINQINKEHNFGNVGYWVRQSQQGKGIASQATQAITTFGFLELKLTRLEIVVAEENIASRRVAEKVGARFECIARNRLVIWGVPHDSAVYSLVPS
ncbi:putative acetyltransferase [Methyloglobulus morosus KoM1]|uniref:Putative acetyltransferase n=1 Tax=Methyloglobulus morosus KoM1 TaxID=1116472 RepID=V5C0X6_9GAMM|nr:GNAT family N-acetyltransferase [Methyloglobulus morosus]ESS72107.1 putative acetyltransferase [Methyloglobulus morosus KoM1]